MSNANLIGQLTIQKTLYSWLSLYAGQLAEAIVKQDEESIKYNKTEYKKYLAMVQEMQKSEPNAIVDLTENPILSQYQKS